MGLVHAEIELSSARDDALEPIRATALVDTGATYMCIPQHISLQLQLPVQDTRGVTLTDGSERIVDYVGPVRVRFGARQCIVGALVLGNQPLLGAIPIEDMDLIIHPSRQQLTVNPDSPNLPMGVAMGHRAGPHD
jgi:clan AA aspartic protease